MDKEIYDIAIIGGGPAGAATAYSLLRSTPQKKIILITEEAADHPERAAFTNAGGSVRWWFDDAEKEAATKETADFFMELSKEEDISLAQRPYVLLPEGIAIPSLNVSGAKVVAALIKRAVSLGLQHKSKVSVTSIKKNGDGIFEVVSGAGIILAQKVLVALGASIHEVFPEAPFKRIKRQLYVLDLPIDEHRAALPHVVLPVEGGEVYFFIKKFPEGLKIVVGEEELCNYSLDPGPEDQYEKIANSGAFKTAAFLKEGKVERILWGFDVANKMPEFWSPEEGILCVACGSAIRMSAYIGRLTAERMI